MASSQFGLDPRKWFERSLPQTLQIGLWLLYINGAFALIEYLDGTDDLGYLRGRSTLGAIVGLIVCVLFIGSGYLIANEKKLGYNMAIAAAFSPFLVRFWAYTDFESRMGVSVSLLDKLTGNTLVGFAFDVALCALVLHPMSRNHQRIWFRKMS
ncbi:MAG: hypothetical protein LW606_05015 [Ilumatobacteraceae bacterium]|nr:hypothetical protein [Ilumatobacteraceae bacterium]